MRKRRKLARLPVARGVVVGREDGCDAPGAVGAPVFFLGVDHDGERPERRSTRERVEVRRVAHDDVQKRKRQSLRERTRKRLLVVVRRGGLHRLAQVLEDVELLRLRTEAFFVFHSTKKMSVAPRKKCLLDGVRAVRVVRGGAGRAEEEERSSFFEPRAPEKKK